MKTPAIALLIGMSVAFPTAFAAVDSGTAFVSNAVAGYVESGEVPGFISVLYDDGVQETTCLGYADVRSKRPITMDDVFMQCSQTKGFCGVTVAMLIEEGKIALDDPVSKYLPEFAELWVKTEEKDGSVRLTKARNTLTVRMAMNHTGGFPFELKNYTKMGGWARRMPLRSVAATAAAQPLLFEPGTKSNYSNVGIDVGAAVVEVVSGMRWEDFLFERVLKPLGMTQTVFRPTDERLERRIGLYAVKGGHRAKPRDQDVAMQRPFGDDRVFPSAGAGLWTTAEDQLKFYKMLMNLGLGDNGVRILKEETVKNLLAVSTRPKGLGGYSLGFFAPQADGKDVWFGHNGAWCTDCRVDWRGRRFKLWVVQSCGGPRPWEKDRDAAAERFFSREKTKLSGSAEK